MSKHQTSKLGVGVRSGAIIAVKITADGRRIPLGVVSRAHANPIINAWWRVQDWFKRRRSVQ